MFNGFYFSKFAFCLRAKDNLALPPYKGSAFRGGFGHAFKKVVCTVKRQTCDSCLLKSKCIYCYIFETQAPDNSEILRKYKSIQHPFVIEPPIETKRAYQPGETIFFNLILIGRAMEYLPYFIYTFEELGKIGIGRGRGKYELSEVWSVLPDKNSRLIYSSDDRVLKDGGVKMKASDILSAKLCQKDKVTLNFLTPVRIIQNRDLVVNFEFHHLIRSLLRRVSTLSYFHCGKRLELDFKGLIERAEKIRTIKSELTWYDWERYSQRQAVRMRLGGLTGKITFQGELEEFLPLIRFGEFIHAGKGTSFGLGRYEIV